jgi:hypothetical protein
LKPGKYQLKLAGLMKRQGWHGGTVLWFPMSDEPTPSSLVVSQQLETS